MAYRKETLEAKIKEAAQNMNTFYQQPFLNWRGKTSNTGDYYTEVTAAYLLENLGLMDQIVCVGREDYHVDHIASSDTEGYSGPRKEEHLAQTLKGQTLDSLGEIKEYQVPLKKSMADQGVGKIDLVSLHGDTLYVIELKTESSKETLLRCAMEAATYCRQAKRERLMEEYGGKSVVPAVLVFKGKSQDDELREKPENLMDLLHKLGVEIFLLVDSGNGEYCCERAEY